MQKHKSSSSFTPFIDPRLLQVSPSTGSALNNVGKSQPWVTDCWEKCDAKRCTTTKSCWYFLLEHLLTSLHRHFSSKSPRNWFSELPTKCRNYKRAFFCTLLIYIFSALYCQISLLINQLLVAFKQWVLTKIIPQGLRLWCVWHSEKSLNPNQVLQRWTLPHLQVTPLISRHSLQTNFSYHASPAVPIIPQRIGPAVARARSFSSLQASGMLSHYLTRCSCWLATDPFKCARLFGLHLISDLMSLDFPTDFSF